MDWRPIETAPRNEADAEYILVCDATDHHGFHQVVCWDSDGVPDGWHWSTSDGPTFHKDAFTHWMPLPEPPTLTAAEG